MKLSEAESRAYDAGNYDGHYLNYRADHSFAAFHDCDNKTAHDYAHLRAPYLAGYYSSCEPHEIADDEHRAIVVVWRTEHPDY